MPKSKYFFGRHWRAAAFESDPRTKDGKTTSMNDNTAVSSTTASGENLMLDTRCLGPLSTRSRAARSQVMRSAAGPTKLEHKARGNALRGNVVTARAIKKAGLKRGQP